MRRARLYVGYIFGFWRGSLAHWEAVNALSPKTLGVSFPSFADVSQKSPEVMTQAACRPAAQTRTLGAEIGRMALVMLVTVTLLEAEKRAPDDRSGNCGRIMRSSWLFRVEGKRTW